MTRSLFGLNAEIQLISAVDFNEQHPEIKFTVELSQIILSLFLMGYSVIYPIVV